MKKKNVTKQVAKCVAEVLKKNLIHDSDFASSFFAYEIKMPDNVRRFAGKK